MTINKLSIIIPAFNEEKTIERIFEKLEEVDLGVEKEIIVVDDGSFDQTREILKKYESRYQIIRQPRNLGKGAAVRRGFEAASGDFCIVQDADLEYDPQDIPRMIQEAERLGAQVIYGSRRLGLAKKKNPMAGRLYYLGGVGLSFLTNFLYGTRLTDEPTGYKMFSRNVLKKIELVSDGFELEPEITAKIARLKIPIYEVPISYHPRSKKEGKKIKIKDGFIAVWTLIKYKIKR